MTPSEHITAEELLSQIIEAQKDNGFDRYHWLTGKSCLSVDPSGDIFDMSDCLGHVLAVILDTEGCKAAYGVEPSAVGGTYDPSTGTIHMPVNENPMWKYASEQILESWHSGSVGNNVRAALETAVSLLRSQ